ncbi:hypothetical protein IRY31_03735 [Corynebacterium afermentans subsp. lipophilum]|uniref:hypothetical protein n=1 Tax=Corynebacterium afermentans TaxID=38286 RepID=UPI00188A37ED|nr:hypothetical protein [Corynebacterium afermentans]MBF4547191.1 hypothetical protein [Corynebacterium afermentans subsp. lipophilum]
MTLAERETELTIANAWKTVRDAERTLYQARARNHAADRALRVAEDFYFLGDDTTLVDLAHIEKARQERSIAEASYRSANVALKKARKSYRESVTLFQKEYGREPDPRIIYDHLAE